MGIAYTCDEATGVTVTVWDGPVSPDDWRKLVAEQNVDPQWPSEHHLGIFETAHGFSSFDDDVVAEMMTTYRHRAQNSPVKKSAIVTQRQLNLATEIPRELQDMGIRVIAFGDLRTACAWLGADLDAIQRIVDDLCAHIAAVDQAEGRLS
jgi:hypothetical protein